MKWTKNKRKGAERERENVGKLGLQFLPYLNLEEWKRRMGSTRLVRGVWAVAEIVIELRFGEFLGSIFTFDGSQSRRGWQQPHIIILICEPNINWIIISISQNRYWIELNQRLRRKRRSSSSSTNNRPWGETPRRRMELESEAAVEDLVIAYSMQIIPRNSNTNLDCVFFIFSFSTSSSTSNRHLLKR